MTSDLEAAVLRSTLQAWYAAHKRALPWRDAGDPYAVWVSEIMLQQTQVTTVTPYFLRWMARFPDIAALAAAPPGDVLACWQGLGYYARARNLHRAARIVVAQHGGALPRTRSELLALPGMGPYAAGAVASIAFGERVPAVDGNARRVLARLAALDGDPARPPTSHAVARLAARLADGPDTDPGDVNQALMELGARVCTPRGPRCDDCPVAGTCRALAEGRTHDLPVRRTRRAPREEHAFAYVLRHPADGTLLVGRRAERGLLGGLWEFPRAEADRDADPAMVALGAFDLVVPDPARLPTLRHVFTHLRLDVTPVVATCAGQVREPRTPYVAWRRTDPAALADLPASTLMRRIGAAIPIEMMR